MSNKNENDLAGIGCVIIFLLIFLIPLLIQLLKVLMVVVIIGGTGFLIYQMVQYDKKTRNVTRIIEKVFNLESSSKNETLSLTEKEDGTFGLPEGQKGAEIKGMMSDMYTTIQEIKEEQERREAQRAEEIKGVLDEYAEKIDRKNKKDLLADTFSDQSEAYQQSDEFEKRDFQDNIKKQKEELEIENLKLNVEKQLFDQDKKIHENTAEAKEDRQQIRLEMKEGFLDVNQKLLHLAEDISTFKGFVTEKFAQVEVQFFKELGNVKEVISNLRVELKQDISDTKVQFGREIVRLDQQQVKIVGKLQEYENKVRAFSYQVAKVRLDCEKFAVRGEDMLNRANTIYQRHKAEMSILSKDLQVGLQQVALHKGDFANKVGAAKLMMDEITQDHYFALKDIAIEKVGVNMLRQDYEQRVSLQEQKMQNLISEKRHLLDKINDEISRGREVNGLRHQLYMTEENLRFASNRANLMQQEHAVMRRLSRG